MEQNSFRYDANIKVSPPTIPVNWGTPPSVNMIPEPESERSAEIDSIFILQPMTVVWADKKESLIFVDFTREQVSSLEKLPQKLIENVTRLIKEKKANHLPPIPTEIVTESIRRKNSIWNNHQEKSNARETKLED